MVTREQAISADWRSEFHYGECTRTVGPRGGIRESIARVRVNGRCQTWKTRPEAFRLPVKYGFRECSAIEPHNAHLYHPAGECPLDGHEQRTVEDYGADAADGAACRAMATALRAARHTAECNDANDRSAREICCCEED